MIATERVETAAPLPVAAELDASDIVPVLAGDAFVAG